MKRATRISVVCFGLLLGCSGDDGGNPDATSEADGPATTAGTDTGGDATTTTTTTTTADTGVADTGSGGTGLPEACIPDEMDDECDACVKAMCCDEAQACLEDADCNCFQMCADSMPGGGFDVLDVCMMECMLEGNAFDHPTIGPVVTCTSQSCITVCT